MSCSPSYGPVYLCHCERCGHDWESRCDCAPVALIVALVPGRVRGHLPACKPPEQCARCRAYNWWRPAWKPGRPKKDHRAEPATGPNGGRNGVK